MKKTLFEVGISGCCYLYVGIEPVYGGFILETGGDPITLNDLEDANTPECDEIIQNINNFISNPNTYWEPCNEEDEEYVLGYLEAWGIDND